jgi:hypothetical protein
VKAGENGLYLAAKAKGKVARDSVTVFFDPRKPELLGTPGGYYWLSIGHDRTTGKMQLQPGETSDRHQPDLKGVWQATADGANLEIFVPYSMLDIDGWPEAGDLGLSIDWLHRSSEPDVTDTHLQWSEDGHPWNPRWYGVIRLTDDPHGLPYMVRIK